MKWKNHAGFLDVTQPSSTVSHSLLSDDGLILAEFQSGERLAISDSIKLVPENLSMTADQITSMSEFLVTNKKTILKDKRLFFLNSSRSTKSSEMLGQASTIKDGDLSPFWNKSKKILSEKLWLPQKIDYVDLDLSSSNGSVQTMGPRSWFSSKMTLPPKKNSLQNCWTSSRFFAVDETENEDTVKTKKVRIYPTPRQKKILATWAHHNRYTYNMTIEKFNNGENMSKTALRDILVTAKNLPDSKKWLLSTPKVIRQQAVFRAKSNIQSAFTNLKNGTIKYFKFHKKKTSLWTMGIEKQINFNTKGEAELFKGEPYKFGKIKTRDKIFRHDKLYLPSSPVELNSKGVLVPKHDCYISKDRYNRYYLLLPIRVKAGLQCKTKKIVSIDPGLRKFMALYSPDGECGYLGINCRDKLWTLLQKLDHYNKLYDYHETTNKARKRLRKKRNAIYRKLGDLKRELHDKTINYLTAKYDHIVLGKLDVGDIVRKEKRVLRTKEVRSIYNLAHYQFRIKLAKKCKAIGKVLHVANESWTSKTCTGCGSIDRWLGGSECYNCKYCGTTIDRDLNGARNILIKTMGELTVRRHESSGSQFTFHSNNEI